MKFCFEGKTVIIQCTPKEKMKDIINRLIAKLENVKKEDYIFNITGEYSMKI